MLELLVDSERATFRSQIYMRPFAKAFSHEQINL